VNTNLTTALAVALAASMATGCGPSDDPCDQDAFGCASNGTMESGATCTSNDALVVVPGWGTSAFHTFDTPPEIEFGAQGGSHFFAAVRVPNAEPQSYSQLLLELRLYRLVARDECERYIADSLVSGTVPLPSDVTDAVEHSAPAAPMIVLYGDGSEPPPPAGPSRCVEDAGVRAVVLGDGARMATLDTGGVEQRSLLMQLPWSGNEGMIVVKATDPCGRQGSAHATFRY